MVNLQSDDSQHCDFVLNRFFSQRMTKQHKNKTTRQISRLLYRNHQLQNSKGQRNYCVRRFANFKIFILIQILYLGD